MVASAVFITDLQGKSIISRNYRGDYPINKAIEVFAKYLSDVEEEARKPIFHVDVNGDFESGDEVGMAGPGGQTFVYVVVSTGSTQSDEKINANIFLDWLFLLVGSVVTYLLLLYCCLPPYHTHNQYPYSYYYNVCSKITCTCVQ